MRYDRSIIGYGDIFDKNGKPIPVTKEMKTLLMSKVPDFVQAYNDGMKALKDAESEKAEELKKN